MTPDRKLNIMWLSSAPWTPYGYGTTTAAVVPRLRDRLGHDVAITAYYGHTNGKLNWRGIDVYPPGFSAAGNDIAAANVRQAGASVLLSHMDVWRQNPTQLTAHGTRWVAWPPLDSEPIAPQIAVRLKAAYQAIALSAFGQAQAALVGLDLPLVLQGVDTQQFTPGSRAAARERLGWPADAFIVGMIAHNKGYPSRKAYPEQLAAFAQFARRHSDALIYLHCYGAPELDPEAPPLPWLLGDMEDRAIWANPYQLNIGYTTEQMVDRYRAFDVLLGCSLSEGFGIPLVEAQACGVPVIAGDWTAMAENVGAGWTVAREDSEPFAVLPLECWWRTPRIGAITDRLEAAYSALQNSASSALLATVAREWAVRERDQDMLVDTQWRAVLNMLAQRIADEPVPFHTHRWAGMGMQTEQGAIAPCLVPDCPAELRVNGTREPAEWGWGVVVDGLTLDIADDPNGGVKHAIAQECVTAYRLQDLRFEPGDVIIDVGAHVGVVSCYLAKKWPAITVYAVEPIPRNQERLGRNIRANGLLNVHVRECAITADGRDLELSGDPATNTGHYSAFAEQGPDNWTIGSMTIAELLDMQRIDRIALLKLDCEGAEYEIIYGMGDLLKEVDHLVMEVHENAALQAEYGSGATLVEYAMRHVAHARASVIRIPDRVETITVDSLAAINSGSLGTLIADGKVIYSRAEESA
jgi:FkbM family methyltransferase